jgi:cation:H+ antiporter
MVQMLLSFLGLALIILICGKKLSYLGDAIAEHLGLGKAWIGLVMVASVTSLPELTVGISSVSLVGSADLALGNIMGSCVFNLFMLSLIDAFIPIESVFSKASVSHTLAGSMSIILFALVGLALFLPESFVISSWIGVSSVSFIAVYFVSMRIIYQYERKLLLGKPLTENAVPPTPPTITLKKAVMHYVLNAVIVVGAALFLPGFAEKIAVETGLGESLVGTLFLAASTVLPEFAVTVGAMRIGALDLAVGNLIGSNLFNILILAVDDIFYTKGYLLKDASDANMASVFTVIIMTAVAIAGLTYRISRKRFFLAWDAMVIALMYILNLYLLYHLRPQK